ncbi:E3 ubiquitin-protein ligase TRIM21-like [Xiphophorus hellerii]|uniref:E3 ubiquitin-protein ligase TRIM21-like n=1 Tax=Xiphophorus hellerii TaxID=8084 RepID=UPI0013B357BB|nr:E3 ubiquitin-protein ligase TRIM21-like [Xiphophorus hellerii]
MATASSFLSEEQFLCSICLDVFTDPVTIPCGHNFCKTCITKHWNISRHQQCPLCKEQFDPKPALRINTFISEMASHFRNARSLSGQVSAGSGGILCEVCTKPKQKAFKSCLACATAYCHTHLEPHTRITVLKRHTLINPVMKLETMMCGKHERPLELFCKTDRRCICPSCAASDHKKHRVVALTEECKEKKKELEKTRVCVEEMIQERLLKMEQFKQSVKLSKRNAEEVTAAVAEDCSDLINAARKSLDHFIDVIVQKQKATEEQTEGFIKELEEEISTLMKKRSELMQLSQIEDHFHLLQNTPTMTVTAKDWTKVRVQSSCDATVRTAAAQLETIRTEMKKLCARIELARVRLYVVDVTLDPNTANPYLVMSDDGKTVRCSDVTQVLPDKPERLSAFGILGKQSFSSGRFYYEVEVKGKTKWELGVVQESIDRKGENAICPENGYWAVWLRNSHYRALTGPSVPLVLVSELQKVGVFVDYDEGLVSFYDAEAAHLIFSFTSCNFSEKLYPYFSPCPSDGGKNSAPLIISSISHTLN